MTVAKLIPVISEKALAAAEQRTYVFEVERGASKIAVARAVAQQFGVKVQAVNTARIRGKPKAMRTKRKQILGRRSDFKKAYVTLKAGDSIKLIEGEK